MGIRRPGRSGCTRSPVRLGPAPPPGGSLRSAGGRGAAQASPGHHSAAGCGARETPAGRRTACWPGPPSGPLRADRAPGRGAPPGCSRAPGRRRRSARPARSRHGGGAHQSPLDGAGTVPRRRTWCSRRRSSSLRAGTRCRAGRTRALARGTSRVRTLRRSASCRAPVAGTGPAPTRAPSCRSWRAGARASRPRLPSR